MSTLAMTSHVPDMVRLARSGNSLIVLETPIYPASDRVIARYMLPAGYGMLQDPHTIAAKPEQLDGRIFNPRIPVVGVPPREPTPVRNILADTAPFAQAALALLALSYAGLAFTGRYHNPSGFLNPSRTGFFVVLFAALAGIYVSAYNPEAAVRDIYGQAHQAVSDIAADRAKLASLITVRNGLVEPFTEEAYQSALRLMRTHYIPDTADLQSKTTVRILATLVPLGLFLLLFSPFAMAGWYHLFIRPPIEKTLKPALRLGGPIDTKTANKDLALNPAQLRNPPPAFQSLSDSRILNVYITETERQAAELAARAKATEAALNRQQSLLDKFNVANRLMRAIQCREVNRRELEELQQKLRETEARLAAQEKVK